MTFPTGWELFAFIKLSDQLQFPRSQWQCSALGMAF
uniref:Uncharacterized protein n=1 Tax=Anguilla anguilla TaxID=7936 RepID=A0A0E9W396_ANGAN